MMKIDFTGSEDEAEREQLMALWAAGDRSAYFKLHDAMYLKQLGIEAFPTTYQQPNPNENYYSDESYPK
jgi:hypothetical protein